MGAGDVVVQILSPPLTSGAIDIAVTAMRNTANDKWLMTSTSEGDVIIVNIEEA